MHNNDPLLTIRAARNSDAGIIATIYNEHIDSGQSTMDRSHKKAKDVVTWLSGFNKKEFLAILEDDASIVGWGIIKRYSDREGYCCTAETAVYLKSEYLGMGYGSYLKKWLIETCRKLGYHHLVAKIFSTNTASIIYNMKLGYELVGVQREVGKIEGQWVDVTILQLVL